MNRTYICRLLNSEMVVATGCTEPAAVALAAATARQYMKEEILEIQIKASANMIKNVMAAGIPGADVTGIEYAAALGATGGDVSRQLQVVDSASKEAVEEACRLVRTGRVSLTCEEVCDRLFVSVKLIGPENRYACVDLAESHTNIIRIDQNGKVVFEKEAISTGQEAEMELEDLSITVIYEFVETLDRENDDLHMIDYAIKINTGIMEEGRIGDYGLNIGRHIRKAKERGYYSDDLVTNAVEDAACGVDARMAGANVPVVTNSGSGNQGITTTIPVISAGKHLRVSEDRIFRGVTLSNLIAIYIHSGFGRLSGLCGATIAATGAACGLVYLMGGGVQNIGYAINNMLGDISGMVCDGAKADCSLKVSTCLQAAFQCAFLAMDDVVVGPTDGIVEENPAHTVCNFNRLGNEGSVEMDRIVLDILMNKKEQVR